MHPDEGPVRVPAAFSQPHCLPGYTLSLNTIHHPTRGMPGYPVYHADTAIDLPSELRPVSHGVPILNLSSFDQTGEGGLSDFGESLHVSSPLTGSACLLKQECGRSPSCLMNNVHGRN